MKTYKLTEEEYKDFKEIQKWWKEEYIEQKLRETKLTQEQINKMIKEGKGLLPI